jgi:hypothetical protein
MISVGGRVTGSVLIDEGGLAAEIMGDGESVDGAGTVADSGGNSGVEAARSVGQNGGTDAQNMGVEGVTASAPTKKYSNRWLPGQSGNPSGWAKKDIKVLHAIHEGYPPDRIIGLLDEALEIARKHNSYRGIMDVARTVIEYTVGKPVQRSITVSSKMDSILTRLESIQVVDGSVLDEAGDEGE